jgi:spore cortex formation protein SpoVR/YcgB (stage V sporulation)
VALLGETIRALQEAEAERGRLRGLLESTEARERSEREAAEAAQEEIVRLRAKVMELEAQAAQEAETAPAEPEPVQDIVASGDQARPWWKRMLGGSA